MYTSVQKLLKKLKPKTQLHTLVVKETKHDQMSNGKEHN